MRSVGRASSSVDATSIVVTILLLVCTLLLVVVPNVTALLTGRYAVAPIAAPDHLPPSTGDDATSFLIRRNVVELVVPEEMTVRELLEVYRLNKPDQTRQVFQQLGSYITSDTRVAAGTRLKISLTPIAPEVPGTPRRKTQP